MTLNVIKVFVLLTICVLGAWADLARGIVPNKVLLVGTITALCLDILGWIIAPGAYVAVQLANIFVLCVIAILLYELHIWAGGDCKLLMTVSLLVPYDMYASFMCPWLSLVLLPAVTFVFSYFFLIGDSFVQAFMHKKTFRKEVLLPKLLSMLILYCTNVAYIVLLDQLLLAILGAGVQPFLFLINICVVLGISNVAILQNRFLIIAAIVLSVWVRVRLGQPIIGIFDLINLGLVLVSTSLRIFIDSYNYTTLPTEQVQTGMILSAATTILFVNSGIKGLPGVSSEDLRARLTSEEVDSVHRWAHSKYGQPTVQIVRKIPFAIFIALGSLSYLILGVAIP